jgi:hypothetical protein
MTRDELIQQYAQGYDRIAKAVEGATEAELGHRPGPGKWLAREVVHHLADSEMTSAIRLRLLLAEDRPVIRGYDQDTFATKLNYQQRPVGAALMAIRAARETTVEILKQMKEEDWNRTGWHTESGPYTPQRWLEIYAKHCHNHAEQIRRALASARS